MLMSDWLIFFAAVSVRLILWGKVLKHCGLDDRCRRLMFVVRSLRPVWETICPQPKTNSSSQKSMICRFHICTELLRIIKLLGMVSRIVGRNKDVPFTPLKKPLSESRVALVTTAAPYQPDKGDQGPGAPTTRRLSSTVYTDTTEPIDLRVLAWASIAIIRRRKTWAGSPRQLKRLEAKA